jgi:hypothetical protein
MTSRQPPRRWGGYPVPSAKRGSQLPPSSFRHRSFSTSVRQLPTKLRFRLLGLLALLVTVLGFGAGALAAWVTAHPNWASRLLGLGPAAEIPAPRAQAKAAQQRLTLPQKRDPFALHPTASFSYVPAIMYHDVVAGRKQVWFDTTVAELRQHFEAIRQAGLTPIHIDQLYKHLRDGIPCRKKPFC